ncbi:MAG: hypothetical protein HC853_03210 [Anaerolineae bacterium]|nr:hypothetical protein [Anaerolineae bacterium]
MAEATLRLRKHMWAKRAVSASDFEVLAREADPRVARAYFVKPPNEGAAEAPRGIADLRIVPHLLHDDYAIPTSPLALSQDLQRNVRSYLDERRLLTTMLDVQAPGYVGVQIKAAVRVLYGRKPEAVQADVARALRAFLCPINVLTESVIQAEDDFALSNVSPLEKMLRQFLAPLGDPDEPAVGRFVGRAGRLAAHSHWPRCKT